MNIRAYVWDVALQVTSPERPALRHQLQYRTQAPRDGRDLAIGKARELASAEGHYVLYVVSAVRRFAVNDSTPRSV